MSLQAAAIYQNPSLVRDVRNREVLFVFLKKKTKIRDVRNILGHTDERKSKA
jgi:nucleoside diphosphate kinase